MSSPQNNIVIPIVGGTASIATQNISDVHYQINVMAYGASGSATRVSSAAPMPVMITGSTGLTASVVGPITVQGNSAGGPVPVSGNVGIYGVTGAAPIPVTGGRTAGYTADSISIYGPTGQPYIPATLVGPTGVPIGLSGGGIPVTVTNQGITLSVNPVVGVTSSSPLEVQGATSGYPLGVSGTVQVTGPALVDGMTAIWQQVVGLRADLASAGTNRPTAATAQYRSMTHPTTATFDGYTCAAGISVKAFSSNNDVVWVGGVTSGSLINGGIPLDPGEVLFIDIVNTSLIAVSPNSGTQKVSILGT